VILAVWAIWPQASTSQTPGGAPQKRQRINTIIERLEQGGVVDKTVRGSIEMEHAAWDIVGLPAKLEEFAKRRKPNGQLEQTPVLRMPTHSEQSEWMTEQALDAGAIALNFPQIETKEEALKIISSIRMYPQKGQKAPMFPRGSRDVGMWTTDSFTGFPLWGKMGPDEYMRLADVWPLNPEGEYFVIIMVETPLGIKNINDIISVPGIGAIIVGSNDLQISLGLGRATRAGVDLAPETDEAILTVARACNLKKVVWGITVPGTEKKQLDLIKLGSRYRYSS